MFLRFLRGCFYVFLILTVFLLPIVLPVNYRASTSSTSQPPSPASYSPNATTPVDEPLGLSRFTIANIPAGSSLFYVHTFFAYVVSFVVYYILYIGYGEYADLANEYLIEDSKVVKRRRSSVEIKQLRTIMITNLPDHLRKDEALKTYFESLGIGQVDSARVDRVAGNELTDLIVRREKIVVALEKAYMKWLGNVEKEESLMGVPKWKRWAVYLRQRGLQSWTEKQQQDENVSNEEGDAVRASPNGNTGASDLEEWVILDARPTHYEGGWFGTPLLGKSVDSIEFYSDELQYLTSRIRQLRSYLTDDSHSQFGTTGFVTFRQQRSAIISAQVICDSVDSAGIVGMEVNLAPAPSDLVWEHLSVSPYRKKIQSLIVTVVFYGISFFWVIPISFVASFASLDELGKLEAFKSIVQEIAKNDRLYLFLQTILPPMAINIFLLIAPIMLQYLSKYQAIESHSLMEKATLAKYFLFLYFNVFFVFALSSAIWSFIGQIVDNPISIIGTLANVIPKGTTFFQNYVIYCTTWVMIDLLRPNVIFTWIFRRLFCTTPRDFFQLNRTTSYLDYGVFYPWHILIFVIVLCYSIISPLIIFFGAIYFGASYLVYKYQLVFVYIKEWEAYGRHYVMAFKRVIVGIVVFQLTLSGMLGVKNAPIPSTLVLLLVPLTIAFYFHCVNLFDRRSKYIPLDKLPPQQVQPILSRRNSVIENNASSTSSSSSSASSARPSRVRFQELASSTLPPLPTLSEQDIHMNLEEEEYWHSSRIKEYANPYLSQKLIKPWLPGGMSVSLLSGSTMNVSNIQEQVSSQLLTKPIVSSPTKSDGTTSTHSSPRSDAPLLPSPQVVVPVLNAIHVIDTNDEEAAHRRQQLITASANSSTDRLRSNDVQWFKDFKRASVSFKERPELDLKKVVGDVVTDEEGVEGENEGRAVEDEVGEDELDHEEPFVENSARITVVASGGTNESDDDATKLV